jgi:hypothetical protein
MAKNQNAGEALLDRLLKQLEQTGLHAYPNPTRQGCPGRKILEKFADDPIGFGVGDPTFEHVTYCSPCLQFVTERRKGKRAADSPNR